MKFILRNLPGALYIMNCISGASENRLLGNIFSWSRPIKIKPSTASTRSIGDELRSKISLGSDNKCKHFPLTPIVKIAPFRQSHMCILYVESGHIFKAHTLYEWHVCKWFKGNSHIHIPEIIYLFGDEIYFLHVRNTFFVLWIWLIYRLIDI